MSTKLIFFGTPDIAAYTLRVLCSVGYNALAVVTQPDKPTGRDRMLTPPPVKTIARELGIPVFQPVTLKDGVFLEELRRLQPDVCVVISYGKIFPASFFEIPPLGFLNVHFSLLPAYRGASPLPTAIMNGDRESGVTIALLVPKVDSGPILAQKRLPIPQEKYYPEIINEYMQKGTELLLEVLPRYVSGGIKPREQDHGQATFTKILTRQDGNIDWDRSAEQIFNQIRALNPEPGTWTTFDKATLRILRASLLSAAAKDVDKPGRVIRHDGTIAVTTGLGLLALELIQREGKKPIAPDDFANGHPDFIGVTLG